MFIDVFPSCCGASILAGFDEGCDEAYYTEDDYETWTEAYAAKKAAVAAIDREMDRYTNQPTKQPLTVCIVADWQRAVMFPILRKHGWTLVRGATTVNPNTNNKLYLWYRDRSKAPVTETKRKF